jgi:antitoxin HicB
MTIYRIELTPDDNGTFLITSPGFPEVSTFGTDEAECRRWGAMAIEEAIAARLDSGADVPIDTAPCEGRVLSVETPLLFDLKVDLYDALKRSGVTRAELARRLGWNRNSVDRLFDMGHASRLSQIEAAMKALGLRIETKIVENA